MLKKINKKKNVVFEIMLHLYIRIIYYYGKRCFYIVNC